MFPIYTLYGQYVIQFIELLRTTSIISYQMIVVLDALYLY